MKLNVPYHSQYKAVENGDWKNKSCGLACLKMVLDYVATDDVKNEPLSSVMEHAQQIGAYKDGAGWTHEGIVRLFRNRGILAYQQEFKGIVLSGYVEETLTKMNDRFSKRGKMKIRESIAKDMPVIVSVDPGLSDDYTDTHMLVITGWDDDGFFYHDPAAKEGQDDKKHQYIKTKEFRNYWRKMVIFVER